MGTVLNSSDYIEIKETPSVRKFQRFIRFVNEHVFFRGKYGGENPAPYEHWAHSIKWSDGAGGGKSVYEKMLEKRDEIILPNDKMAAVIISKLPDETGSRTLFLDNFKYVCDGTNDATVIQRAIDQVIAVASLVGAKARIFIKNGVYNIDKQLIININSSLSGSSIGGVSLKIEGEPGTIFESNVTPSTTVNEMIHCTVLGNINKDNKVEFNNIVFRRNEGPVTLVRCIHGVTSDSQAGIGKIIFKRCSFHTDSLGYAIELSRSTTGSIGGHVLFQDCTFNKSLAHYDARVMKAVNVGELTICRCQFYDFGTVWNLKDPYEYVEAEHQRISLDGTENAWDPIDKTVISGPLILAETCDKILIKDNEFKFFDTVIYAKGKGVDSSMHIYTGNIFYQLNSMRTSFHNPGATDDVGLIVSVNSSTVATNNVFLSRVPKHYNTGGFERELRNVLGYYLGYPVSTNATYYNVSNMHNPILNQYELVVTADAFTNHTIHHHRQFSLRCFRTTRTDRDSCLARK